MNKQIAEQVLEVAPQEEDLEVKEQDIVKEALLEWKIQLEQQLEHLMFEIDEKRLQLKTLEMKRSIAYTAYDQLIRQERREVVTHYVEQLDHEYNNLQTDLVKLEHDLFTKIRFIENMIREIEKELGEVLK